MPSADIAVKTYTFFAYQYFIRYPMVEDKASIISTYIKQGCKPTNLHLVFDASIWFRYRHLIRSQKNKSLVDSNILEQKIHNSDLWVKHEFKHDLKSDANEVNKYYSNFEIPPLEPIGLFPFSNSEITEEGENAINDNLYKYVKIKKGFENKFLHEMLDLYLENDMNIDESFAEKHEKNIINSYINHHHLIKINNRMRMRNRVFGLWILDFILKDNLPLDNPQPAIDELLYFSPELPEGKMIDIYKRTLFSVLKLDLYPMSN